MIWHERGGRGARTVLLLHGLGATAAVWRGVIEEIERRELGHWIAPDLTGHGLSSPSDHYSVGGLAADLAPLLADCENLFIIGHSLGAYVGLALASRWFGVRVAGVLGVGPKITWSDADLQSAYEFAARPAREFATEEEAFIRYRRISGVDERIAPRGEVLARGVVFGEQGFRLAQDPRTFRVAGAPFATLTGSAAAPIMLARGERDAMVSIEELRAHAADARDVLGAGHNVHIEHPGSIVTLFRALIERS